MGKGGEKSGEMQQPAADLRSNPLFAEVLKDDFQAIEFVSNALARSTANAQVLIVPRRTSIKKFTCFFNPGIPVLSMPR